MAGVELRSVTKRFGKTYAVRDVSLSVEKGEFLSLVGPSGCGKTTTLRLVAGFLNPDSGDVLLDGQSVKSVGAGQRQVGRALGSRSGRAARGAGQLNARPSWGFQSLQRGVHGGPGGPDHGTCPGGLLRKINPGISLNGFP